MKASLNWINEYLTPAAALDEAVATMERLGFPADGVDLITSPDGNEDHRVDFEVTSNRSDCLSHLGLARELAAGLERELQPPPDISLPEGGPPASERATVTVDDDHACPLYTARVIAGVTIAPSPAWLVAKLEALGLRAVNNVVDITNFVLLELGQPLHAFDLDKLTGDAVRVRTSGKGERFVAIDGSKHELTGRELVIADADRPHALAGVMGGADSEVTDATTDLLLESAIFDPLTVRGTSRRLKLASDSSYRFERGVDPRGVVRASRRAASLILELAGGTLAAGVLSVGNVPMQRDPITLRARRCNELLGIELTIEQQAALLDRLHLAPKIDMAAGTITCTPPTYRLDLTREVDLIEEIARLHGLDAIPVRDRVPVRIRSKGAITQAREVLRQTLTATGYHEAITFSFVGERIASPFASEGQGSLVRIEDERRKAEPILRPSLLPSLLTCRKANQDAGNAAVQLYEAGSAWRLDGERIVEHERLALLSDVGGKDRRQAAVAGLRGTMESVVQRLGGGRGKG